VTEQRDSKKPGTPITELPRIGSPEPRPMTRLVTAPRGAQPLVARDLLPSVIRRAERTTITTVVAPYGSGKTSLGLLWSRAVAEPNAWLTMAPSLSDPATFLLHLEAAIGLALPGFQPCKVRDDAGESPGAAIAAALATAAPGLLLVIDDAHLIDHPETVAILTDFLINLPDGHHVLLLARAYPPLPFSTFRVRGMTQELSASHLAFSESETEALASALEVSLSAEDLRELRRRTDGWIGGLRLAISRMEAAQERGRPETVEEALEGLDNLAADLLSGAPEHLRRIVLMLSMFDEISQTTGEALAPPGTPPADVRAAIALMKRSGLLIDFASGPDACYKLQPLIAKSLRLAVGSSFERDELDASRSRALRLYEQSGKPLQAVMLAVDAGRHVDACDLAERVIPHLLAREDWRSTEAVLRALPAEMLNQRPRLLLAGAWVSSLSGRAVPIQEFERRAQAIFTVGNSSLADQERILAEFRLLRYSNNTRIDEAPAASLQVIRDARQVMAPDQRLGIGLAHYLEGWALGTTGNLEEAVTKLIAESARESEVIDACTIRALLGLMLAYRVHGKLSACERTSEDALALAMDHDLPVSAAWAALIAGWMAYERDDLPLALHRFRIVEAAGEVVHMLCIREATVGQALTHLALGNPEEASAVVTRFSDLVIDRRAVEIMPNIRSIEARLALYSGDLGAARAWLESSTADPRPAPLPGFEHAELTRARIHLAHGSEADLAEASRLIEVMRSRAERASGAGLLVEIHALSAVAAWLRGAQEVAVAELRRSLAIGLPEGYRRTYIDIADALQPILKQMDADGAPEAAALAEILASAVRPVARGAAMPRQERPESQPSILSVLTIREAEVLLALMRRLTNAEIADELSISVQTVKSHAGNVYGKLGVGSRREAIIAASDYDMSSVEVSRHPAEPERPQSASPHPRTPGSHSRPL
jgi:LuxR family transcriptional regulator, maltose regulon positive regulatory protein